MFWIWGAVAVLQVLRPARRAWTEGFAIGAAAFAAIPVVDTLTTSRGLPGSILTGDTLFAAFDFAMLAIAAMLALGAWRSARSRPVAKIRKPQSETVHA